jgi:DNA polymerase lambda
MIYFKVKEAAYKINPGLICMACGSYRRGKADCGDVDILITHPDGKSHKGVFSKLLSSLHESGRQGVFSKLISILYETCRL